MPKVNKVYASFYNGVSEQVPELMLETNCKEMTNCIPNIVYGLKKRPPLKFINNLTYRATSKVFHSYDRGEDDEEYIMVATGSYNEPIEVYDREGVKLTVLVTAPDAIKIKDYLNGTNLKGLTVQDRTWIFNKDKVVTLDKSATTPLKATYKREAYYWLNRSSSDTNNKYRYAVYLNSITYSVEEHAADSAATALTAAINAGGIFSASCVGTIIKITKIDGADFTFSSWDSWGSQASMGWKGETTKITDLPKEHTFLDTYVRIAGDEANSFTSYYVKWNGTSWEECLDPEEDRGILTNMPLALDRTGVGEFTLSILNWAQPVVGNIDNNPDPSFVGSKLLDLFFYKNRLGIASSDSIVMSKAAEYNDFYIKTVVDVLDTDPIDISVASTKASKIYYVKPFNNSLYIFTKDSQFEMVSDGFLSPKNVSIDVATNYPIAVNVEPQVINNSLYFISTTGGKQQLREYIKTEKLTVEGLDLNIATPNYLKETITSLQVNGVLGYVICTTSKGVLYVYNYKETGKERVQSAWSKWQLLEGYDINNFEYTILDADLVVIYKYDNFYRFSRLALDSLVTNDKFDTIGTTKVPYNSSILLPDFYPHLKTIGTPKDKILLKKVIIEGSGNFDANVYRKDYNRNYIKSHTDSMMQDFDLHIASKVGNVDITISDNTDNDFVISSIVMEGLFTPTSKEIK